MPGPAYFEQFGVYVSPRFLAGDECLEVVHAMASADEVTGQVWIRRQGDNVHLETKRRKEMVRLDGAVEQLVGRRLVAVKDDVARHFDAHLADLQPLKFVRYDRGDYYRRHLDISGAPTAPEIIQERKVSVVVFLNDEADDPCDGCYGGGNLTFYGLLPDPMWRDVGHLLKAEAGLMVAFLPHTKHEVTPVTWGSRFTITTWYR